MKGTLLFCLLLALLCLGCGGSSGSGTNTAPSAYAGTYSASFSRAIGTTVLVAVASDNSANIIVPLDQEQRALDILRQHPESAQAI